MAKKKAPAKVEWLCRSLVESPVHYALCTSEAQFHAELRRIDLPGERWSGFLNSEHAGATTHLFTHKGKRVALVCIADAKSAGVALLQVYAMLVHEAVHIWQDICSHIGERYPSDEFEAYSVQRISQALFFSYNEQMGIKT